MSRYIVTGEQYTSGKIASFDAESRAGAIALLDSLRLGSITSRASGAVLARKRYCSQKVRMKQDQEQEG